MRKSWKYINTLKPNGRGTLNFFQYRHVSNASVSLSLPTSNIPPQGSNPSDSWICGIHSATRLLQAYGNNVSLPQMVNEIGPLTINLDIINAVLSAIGINSNVPNIPLPVGNRTDNIVQGMRRYEGNAKEQKFVTFEYLRKLLANGKPVAALLLVGDNVVYGVKIPLLHWVVLTGFDDETKLLNVFRPELTNETTISYSNFLNQWRWGEWQPYAGGEVLQSSYALEANLYLILDKLLGRNSLFWIDRTSNQISLTTQDAANIQNSNPSDTLPKIEFPIEGRGVTNCGLKRAYQDAHNYTKQKFGFSESSDFYIDALHLKNNHHRSDSRPLGGSRSCSYNGNVKAYATYPTYPHVPWLKNAYYGSKSNQHIDCLGNGQSGLFFANVYGHINGQEDAIVVNSDKIVVKKNHGNRFSSNQFDWTTGPYFGSKGTYFANLYGHSDGRADAIVVTEEKIVVKKNKGTHFSSSRFDWTTGPYFGSKGTYFANLYGHSNGRADAIVVNSDKIVVKKNEGTHFSSSRFDWTTGPYFGSKGTYFANIYGHSDGRADAIVVNEDKIVVRKNEGTRFSSSRVDWTTRPFYGSCGTFFANVYGHSDGRVDVIAVNKNSVSVLKNNGTAFRGQKNHSVVSSYLGSRGTFFSNMLGKNKAEMVSVSDDAVHVLDLT